MLGYDYFPYNFHLNKLQETVNLPIYKRKYNLNNFLVYYTIIHICISISMSKHLFKNKKYVDCLLKINLKVVEIFFLI